MRGGAWGGNLSASSGPGVRRRGFLKRTEWTRFSGMEWLARKTHDAETRGT